MIELPVEQGSQSWHLARMGMPTASQFHRIVTPTGKLSTSREEYLAEILAAYFCGQTDSEGLAMNEWIERGKMLEPQAIAAYSFITGREPRRTGFCYRDETRTVGASPDWLLDPDGCGEVKCPMPRQHLIYLVRGVCPREYFAQVQGELWVTQRDWCDFVSFCPGLPILVVRCYPDANYQAALDYHLPRFADELAEAKASLISRGVVDPWVDTDTSAADREWFDSQFGDEAT